MKILFLNCWYGQTEEIFFDFIKEHSFNTDIFCFQEIPPELNQKLKKLLSSHQAIYNSDETTHFGFKNGDAIFVLSNLPVLASGKKEFFDRDPNEIGYLQYSRIKIGNTKLLLGNVHGLAHPGTKLDNPKRLIQSRGIIDFFKKENGLKIIGGDFNLLPETKSIGMIEKAGYRNLIKEYKIKSTRNNLSWKNLKEDQEKQYFADYVFVSKDIKVTSFSVPHNEVSDHLPLILNFEV
jgi:hypothetical protein